MVVQVGRDGCLDQDGSRGPGERGSDLPSGMGVERGEGTTLVTVPSCPGLREGNLWMTPSILCPLWTRCFLPPAPCPPLPWQPPGALGRAGSTFTLATTECPRAAGPGCWAGLLAAGTPLQCRSGSGPYLLLGSLSSASPSVYSFPVIGGCLRSQGWLPAGTAQGDTGAAAGAPARPRSLSQL